jgi:hypothetical protein
MPEQEQHEKNVTFIPPGTNTTHSDGALEIINTSLNNYSTTCNPLALK